MYRMMVLIIISLFLTASCDKVNEKSPRGPKLEVLAERTFTPSKLTPDLELLAQGQVVMVTVLEQHEILEIGYMLYSETQHWIIKDKTPYGPKHPHQINQFVYMYNGYWIDIRESITLQLLGYPDSLPPATNPTPPSNGP